MKDFWNDRYSKSDYAYGIEPNVFFKKIIETFKTGKLLLPAEGEGRNAIFASKLGWDVTAFDLSINAKKKAETLAIAEKSSINYCISDYNNFEAKVESFDCIALIFAHMPQLQRGPIHKKLLTFLKPGGQFILEGFSKEQINKDTGGPKNIDMLFSKEELLQDFASAKEIEITELETILREGLFHNGKASVIRMIAEK